MSDFVIPDPEITDSSAVTRTLVAAHAELARGEAREALRLVRQAAEASEEAGDDARALALARSAAELANELGGSLPPPASPSEPTETSSAPAPLSGAAPLPEVEPDLTALLASGQAVRVLIKRSVRDQELYIVRRPVDGKPVYDAREAVLVLVEPDPDFFAVK